jgi:uncharacterized protein (DUF433 family)
MVRWNYRPECSLSYQDLSPRVVQRRPQVERLESAETLAEPAVRFGKPCIRGTRTTVGDVLGYLAAGLTAEMVVADFPELTTDDVRAYLAYAAERERRTLSIPAA